MEIPCVRGNRHLRRLHPCRSRSLDNAWHLLHAWAGPCALQCDEAVRGSGLHAGRTDCFHDSRSGQLARRTDIFHRERIRRNTWSEGFHKEGRQTHQDFSGSHGHTDFNMVHCSKRPLITIFSSIYSRIPKIYHIFMDIFEPCQKKSSREA